MEPCRSPLEIEIFQSQQPSMWCSKGISGVPQTHQILNKSRQEIMEILLVGKGYRPKENKPKMKLPLGQRVKFWSTYLCHIELRYCSSLKSGWVTRFFLAFQKRNIFVLNILIYRFERGVDVTKAPAVLKEYHSARDPMLPFFQVGHGTVRVP